MPTPSQVDGKFHTVAGGDYNLGINVNSKNKATARAWIDWFNHDSGYSEAQVGLSPLIDGPVPAALEGFMSEVELITMNPAPEGKESLFADIDTASGIVTTDPKYRLPDHRRRPLRCPHQGADLRRPERQVGRGTRRRRRLRTP